MEKDPEKDNDIPTYLAGVNDINKRQCLKSA